VKRDSDFFLEILAQGASAYVLEVAADETVKRDRDFFLAAVKQDFQALTKFADEALKADREIVLAAVTEDGTAVELRWSTPARDSDTTAA